MEHEAQQKERFPQVADLAHSISLVVGSRDFRVSIDRALDRVIVSHDGESLAFAPIAAWRLINGDRDERRYIRWLFESPAQVRAS
jgi:hypothetical protein